MDHILTNEEVRVLGCLMEKKMTTPEYYPLSLNALTNACNQKSNRDPVVTYDEETVLQAIDGLSKKQLAWESTLSRVPKYEERFDRDSNFNNQEAAVMCVLMLRGPQTVGEIRGRTERLHAFESLEEVNHTLKTLASIDRVVRMPRLPGHKEDRHMHLMCGQPEETGAAVPVSPVHSPRETSAETERLALLEEKVEALSSELGELKQLFLDFKRQFE